MIRPDAKSAELGIALIFFPPSLPLPQYRMIRAKEGSTISIIIIPTTQQKHSSLQTDLLIPTHTQALPSSTFFSTTPDPPPKNRHHNPQARTPNGADTPIRTEHLAKLKLPQPASQAKPV